MAYVVTTKGVYEIRNGVHHEIPFSGGRHRAERTPIDKALAEVQLMLRAAVTFAGAAGLTVVAGMLFHVSALISGGSWGVVLAGVVGFVATRAEKIVIVCSERVDRETTGRVGDEPAEVLPVARPQADEAGREESCPGESATVRSELRLDSDRDSGELRGGGAHALLPQDDTGGGEVVGESILPAPLSLRPKAGGRPRERFVVVRDQVGSPSRGGWRGATHLRPISRSDFRKMQVLRVR